MKIKKILASPITTVALFVVAAGLLLTTTMGGARAALTYYSENYITRVQMHDIGVTLVQETEHIAWRDYDSKADGTWDTNEGHYERDSTDGPYASLLEGTFDGFLFGKETPCHLAAHNSGNIDEFVRMTIYTYWVDEDGNKQIELDPGFIEIKEAPTGSWLYDPESTTDERRVYYYNTILHAGETTPFLSDAVVINEDVLRKVSESNDGAGNITTTYDYAGKKFQLKVVVDAVQTHNADDAIWSAWGRRLTWNGSTLTFVN